jgi:hypothetical protein
MAKMYPDKVKPRLLRYAPKKLPSFCHCEEGVSPTRQSHEAVPEIATPTGGRLAMTEWGQVSSINNLDAKHRGNLLAMTGGSRIASGLRLRNDAQGNAPASCPHTVSAVRQEEK